MCPKLDNFHLQYSCRLHRVGNFPEIILGYEHADWRLLPKPFARRWRATKKLHTDPKSADGLARARQEKKVPVGESNECLI